MEKPLELIQKKVVPNIQTNKELTNLNSEKSVGRDIEGNNKKTLKIIFLVFVAVSVIVLIFFSIVYYKRNFTPNAILAKSVRNMLNKQSINYEGTVRIAFSYINKEESLNLSDLEMYSLLKRSISDNHEMIIRGEHSWTNGFPEGKYNLTWSISDKKMFGFEGYYQGYELFYKANPYVFPDSVDEEIKKNYSKVNIGELLEKTLTPENYDLVKGLHFEDIKFQVMEVFQSDLIEGKDAFHYKVKLSGVNESEKLLRKFDYENFDVWIDKKSLQIKRIEGIITLVNIGMEGNNMDVQFDLKLSI